MWWKGIHINQYSLKLCVHFNLEVWCGVIYIILIDEDALRLAFLSSGLQWTVVIFTPLLKWRDGACF